MSKINIHVGAEYLVGNMLIQRKKSGKNYVSFYEVGRVGWEVQKAINDAGIDAIISRNGSDVKALVYDFPDCFQYAEDYASGGIPLIVSERSIECLRIRFCGRLPSSVMEIMTEQIEKNLQTDGMKVHILGTEYAVAVKKYCEDTAFARRSILGYCDDLAKEIVICDPSTCEGWKYEPQKTIDAQRNETLRHEIVHAFLSESGLSGSSGIVDVPWARNEEMVDWIAMQGPKLYKAWKEADALDTGKDEVGDE